jgi:hypothetical protein
MIRRISTPLPNPLVKTPLSIDEPIFKQYKLPKSIDDNVKKTGVSKRYDYFYFDEDEHVWKASS